MPGFQSHVNTDPAPGIEGDWWGANPRRSMIAGMGRLTSGAAGVIVGRFAWALNADGTVQNAKPATGTARLGFVHRDQPAVITAWLGGSTMTVTPGLDMTLHDAADVLVRFPAGAAIGDKVFAMDADGSVTNGAAGAQVANAHETPWFVHSACGAGELAKISTQPVVLSP